ncbi:MAG: 3-isopropylmalate dehydrogenase [Myxococcota bacterium]|jgi:3-isopropylmalate dehydrogenase
MTRRKIAVLPGDGIGPEVTAAAVAVLERIGDLSGIDIRVEEALIGGAAIDSTGSSLPEQTLEVCRDCDAVLLGAVGGPQWDPRAEERPESGLLGLRKELGVFANLRPVKVHPAMSGHSPMKRSATQGVDIMIVRELTGGIYFGESEQHRTPTGRQASDTMTYHETEIRRVVRLAFRLARQRRGLLTSVDKANVLQCSRLWREVVDEVAWEFPDVRVEHRLVDACAMQLITDAQHFDVVVTSNLFGDVLTDEAAVLSGSLGLLPSASLSNEQGYGLGLYEPIHGSAPDLAGLDVANPTAAILSAAMLLRHSCNMPREANAVEYAVSHVLHSDVRTADVGGDFGTMAVTDAVLDVIEDRWWVTHPYVGA